MLSDTQPKGWSISPKRVVSITGISTLVVGRKNYLFSGNDSGAEDNCIFYTLLGSCLQAGVDPHTWLTSTLEKIPTLQTPINWEELLP